MSNLAIQTSFNSGEWSPNLFARVDMQKWRAGAALLQNFFVDYRGGASTRMGTKYVIQAYKSQYAVRLFTFQAGYNVGYCLEWGQNYLRFHYQGSPILETSFPVTSITQANPGVLTAVGHNYIVGDWVYITGVLGMTQIDGSYAIVHATTTNTITLYTLFNTPLNTSTFTAYASGGTVQRIYTLTTPYAASDLALLKFAGIQNEMVLTHPSYDPQLLTLIGPANWTITAITFGSTALPPTGVTVTTTLSAGSVNYAYEVTSIDSSGQESVASAVANLTGKVDIQTTAGSNKITWTPAQTAVAYNVYESDISFFGVVPNGVTFGFIGTCKNNTFIDSNIVPDFSETPPIAYNPFTGSGVAFATATSPGLYNGLTVPTITPSGGSPSIPSTFGAVIGVSAAPSVTSGGTGYNTGDTINFGNSLVVTVSAQSGGVVSAVTIASPGNVTTGTVPSGAQAQVSTSGTGTGLTVTPNWGVIAINVLTSGAGYTSAPTLVFSAGTATGTTTLGATSSGNPGVVSFFQQRLVLAAPSGAPSTFFMSQPGLYFNFNINDPVTADDSITETLVSRTLENIKAIVSSTSGMLVLTDQGSWLVNGGGSGSAVSPAAIVAAHQSSVGANDVPPIIANYDILYVQAKGSAVRDLAYNIYFNIFTGQDISTISSHLFFGYSIKEWAWAEQPFYCAWAVRSDGTMLTLTFLKDQEFIAWTHHTTQGTFNSVTTVTESTPASGNVDAVYTVVARTVNGSSVQYIERIADRSFPTGLSSAWCVDAGIQYSGVSALSFIGAPHLSGLSVTGLATDSLGNVTVITPFTMPANGQFTLHAPTTGATGYTVVTVGLGFTCQLQTLPLDLGQGPPMQGKVKKIPHVDVRVKDALGLSIGGSFSTLVAMKDLVPGNVSSMSTGLGANQVVAGLYTGDARTFLDPSYTVLGQYCIQQSNPYPATVLGLFPALTPGDPQQ